VTANVSRLLEAGFARQVQITTIVGPHNIDELEQLFALFEGMQGLSSWRLASTDPIGRAAGDGSLALDGAQHRILLEFILAHNTSKLPVFYACPSHLGEYEMRARDRKFCCHAGKSVMSILHNGDVAACPNIPRNRLTVQGNIRDTMIAMDLLSVWDKGYVFHRDPDARHSRFCEGCEVWEDCLGGSLHTFDFEKRQQRKCIRKALA
jgi:radical SAM protein with 4Fe4S-binding SPASM domain